MENVARMSRHYKNRNQTIVGTSLQNGCFIARIFFFLALCIVACSLFSTSLYAQTTFRQGSGAWLDGRWSNGNPTPNSFAIVDREVAPGFQAIVFANGTGNVANALSVPTGQVWLDSPDDRLAIAGLTQLIGDGDAGSGLLVEAGEYSTVSLEVDGVGGIFGSNGQGAKGLHVTGGNVLVTEDISLGLAFIPAQPAVAFGSVYQDGGSIQVGRDLFVGKSDGGVGTLVVTGNAALFEVQRNFLLGDGGDGTANLSGGSTFSVAGDFIAGNDPVVPVGNSLEGNGVITVEGAGTSVSVANDATLGVQGQGVALVNSGANWTVGQNLFVALEAGSSGVVIIDGAGSLVNVGGAFSIGVSGAGTATLSNGGRLVSADHSVIGRNTGATGTVTVEGGASLETTGKDLVLGFDGGNGTLNVNSGGTVDVGSILYAGLNVSSTGTVNVDGTGSRITSNSAAWIGHQGTGTVNLTNGAVLELTGSNLRLGNLGTDSSGTLNVSGSSQVFTGNFDMQVGFQGTGLLTVADTATVGSAKHLVLGNFPSGNGTVTQSGGTVTVGTATSGDAIIGEGGTGIYTMTGGQLNVTRTLFLGRSAGGNGQLSVDGNGTLVEATNARIGDASDAIFEISNNGEVRVNGNISLSRSGGESNVIVRDSGRLVSTTFDIHIGYLGTSTATVTNNGAIDAGDDLFIALNEGSVATLDVTDGHITAGNRLRASTGLNTTSTLNLSGSNATVNVTNDISLGIQGTTTATISGGALIEAGGSLLLGESESGSGTLSISSSCVVGATNAYVGIRGEGSYHQTGGELSIQQDLHVAEELGSRGTAIIDGGDAFAENLYIKQSNTDQTQPGRLSIRNTGNVAINREVTIDNGGELLVEDLGVLTMNNDLTLNSNSSATISGGTLRARDIYVNSNSSLILNGTGTLKASQVFNDGSITFTGGNLDVGEISGESLVQEGGSFRPGGANQTAESHVFGTFEHIGGTIEIEIAGENIHDKVSVLNFQPTTLLSGTMELSLIDGYVPEIGDQFDVFSANVNMSPSGEDSLFIDDGYMFDLPDLFGLEFEQSIVTEEFPFDDFFIVKQTIVYTVVSALLGDFNADGTVDAADYTVWRAGLGTTYTEADYTAWRANYGSTLAASSVASVPEPSAVALLLTTLLLASVFHRQGLSA